MQRLAELAEADEHRRTVRAAAADFLRRAWSLDALRERIERDASADAPDLWSAMQRLGWHAIDALPDASGNALGASELCAIVEETGRALAPTPLVACVVGRTAHASPPPHDAELPVLAHGERERTSDRLRTSVVAREAAGTFRLSGTKSFVPYGLQADLLIVPARAADGALGLFALDAAASGVERTALALLDFSPCAEIRLDDAAATPLAWREDAERRLRDALALETIARCAELVGVADRALELAVEYAKTRIAFDRPIGSFQAVQHRLVNLRGCVEIARALYEAAAGTTSDERPTAASMAAFAALDDLRKVPEGALQVFGGIGTTWEHDIHLFVRRAATLTSLLGERTAFREDIVEHLEAARG